MKPAWSTGQIVKPAYEIRVRKISGSPHTSHKLIVDGKVLRDQLSPFSESEIAGHIATHIAPPGPPMKAFVAPKPGRPKKKTAGVNDRGFIWKETEE